MRLDLEEVKQVKQPSIPECGRVLADMSTNYWNRVINWRRSSSTDPTDPQLRLIADNTEEADKKEDFFFVFKVAMVTHLQVDSVVNDTTILQWQAVKLEKLEMLKHEFWLLEEWLLKFKD